MKTYRIYLFETIGMQESLALETLKQEFPSATLIAEPSFVDKSKRPDFVGRSIEIFFEDHKNKEIEKVCKEAYELMKKMVEEAENTFK